MQIYQKWVSPSSPSIPSWDNFAFESEDTMDMVKNNNGLDQILLKEPRKLVNMFGGQVSS